MYKIFYHPKTLKIMGMCDEGTTMDFPFITTAKEYHSLEGLNVVREKDKYVLKVVTPPKPKKYCGRMRAYKKSNN